MPYVCDQCFTLIHEIISCFHLHPAHSTTAELSYLYKIAINSLHALIG